MNARTALLYAAIAVPPLALAIVGITHPIHLTAQSAEYWRNLHIAILPVFPLLGFAPWLLVRGWRAPATWVVGILAFVYAAFYTALDVLAGIGAGGLKLDDMGMATGTVFGLGRDLGAVGSYALIAATLITAVVGVVRAGPLAIPGGVIALIGSYLFLRDHIYFPGGVVGQLCLAIGWVLLAAAIGRASRQRSDQFTGVRQG
jgi:hypothetical protein